MLTWPKMSFSTSYVLTHHRREGPPLCDPSTDTPCLTHIRRNVSTFSFNQEERYLIKQWFWPKWFNVEVKWWPNYPYFGKGRSCPTPLSSLFPSVAFFVVLSLRAWMRMLYSSGHEVSRPSWLSRDQPSVPCPLPVDNLMKPPSIQRHQPHYEPNNKD